MHGEPPGGPLPPQYDHQHHHHHSYHHAATIPPSNDMMPALSPEPHEPRNITPPPPQQPVSSFSFPPGLIPELVRSKSKYSSPYSPISPLDIDRAGLPPPPEKDNYLKSQLDRFAAELRDWRPGTSRADLEDMREREYRDQGRELPEEEDFGVGGARGGRSKRPGSPRSNSLPVDPDTGMLADGSYAGGGKGGTCVTDSKQGYEHAALFHHKCDAVVLQQAGECMPYLCATWLLSNMFIKCQGDTGPARAV